ncbi:MAG: FRG domain-containing protein [Proteobacteria bacterium]|nr:FRG domain-containing protein [Pseudomonadota bacterium]
MLDLGDASNIGELFELARAAEDRLGEVLWFRGHSHKEWKLVPSAHRRHQVLETQFVQHFRLRAPSIHPRCPAHADYASWLPLMQHYGLPTRLLDWSESVLVAAYFALERNTMADGHIYAIAPGELNSMSIGRYVPFLTHDRVAPVVAQAFGASAPDSVSPYVATYAPRSDRRMAAQLGNYTIHSTREPLESCPLSDRFLGRIGLPKNAINQFRRDLGTAGVRTATLFPDLEHLACEIADLRALGADGEDLENTDIP